MMKGEKMKYYYKEHWGNYLTVALMAKIRDWKNIKIIYIPSNQIEAGGFPHFMWHDLIDNNVYDFKPLKHQNTICEVFWCKGKISCRSYDAYLRWRLNEIYKIGFRSYDAYFRWRLKEIKRQERS